MNRIDSATLRYPEIGTLWQDRHGRSEERWLKERVTPDLASWEFNTIGWSQEVIIRTETMHRHSKAWLHEAYTWTGIPYFHLLPFTETHQWEVETRLPDVFSEDFERRWNTVTREHCVQMVDDPNLIGYFHCDCPTWVHTRPNNATGAWFDPACLESAAERAELDRMTERYCQVTHDAIRRYDPNHLILGDRYEGKALLPNKILLAAAPYVRCPELSILCRAEPDRRQLLSLRQTNRQTRAPGGCLRTQTEFVTLSGNDRDAEEGG